MFKEVLQEDIQVVSESHQFELDVVVPQIDLKGGISTTHIVDALLNVRLSKHRLPELQHQAILRMCHKLLAGVQIEVDDRLTHLECGVLEEPHVTIPIRVDSLRVDLTVGSWFEIELCWNVLIWQGYVKQLCSVKRH